MQCSTKLLGDESKNALSSASSTRVHWPACVARLVLLGSVPQLTSIVTVSTAHALPSDAAEPGWQLKPAWDAAQMYTLKALMPDRRTRFAAAVFNNQIWVIGGYNNVAGTGEFRFMRNVRFELSL